MDLQSHTMNDAVIIIGSYTMSLPHVVAKGAGISVLRMDGRDGALSPISTFPDIRNPTYLALSNGGRTLYSVEEIARKDGASVAALRFDVGNGSLSMVGKVSAEGDYPCHLAIDHTGRMLFVSNYGSGNMVTYFLDGSAAPKGKGIDIQRSGSGPNPDRQEGPHVHQVTVTPDNRHVLVCDAGTDEIARHKLSDGLIEVTPDLVVKTKSGSLPRHLVFARDGTHFFVVHELGCCVSTYSYGRDGIRLLSEISTLPEGFDGQSACAAIRLHPNGRFLYASNRGHDSIAAFEISGTDGALRSVGWYPTLGKTPRDFAIDPTGRYLVAANQDSHSLAVFIIDQDTGALQPVGQPYEIGSPVCVVFATP